MIELSAVNGTGRLISRPTLGSLRALLDEMEADGWSPDQQIQIKQLANAPEAFTVDAVEEWLGSTP